MSKQTLLKSTEDHDATTEAALSVVEMELKQSELRKKDQTLKEELIAQTYRAMGRIETADLFGKLASVASLVWLKQVKESKIYKDISGIVSWESFCNHLGKSRRSIDEQLQNLDVLGEEFLASLTPVSLGQKDLRKLRKSVSDGLIQIEDKAIKIDGETIPLDPDHKEDLEVAIGRVLDAKDRLIEEAVVEVKTQKRINQEKSRVINLQEKELSKYEAEIKARDFKPGEEKYIQKMKNLEITLFGVVLQMDPEKFPSDATHLMKAAYLSTLEYFRRTAQAYYDTACDMIGVDGDEEWTQPKDDLTA